MPLFEFRCLKCNDLFEMLFMGKEDNMEMRCPHCGAEDFERVMSNANFAMGSGKGPTAKPGVQTRQCGDGSCSTLTLPGHTKD